ncbi:MAG TPA: DUF4169 family protein [Alphaproteobacteria bacterium]|nr:DUF4169 family protein [Alphaproteobacteria bacterium]
MAELVNLRRSRKARERDQAAKQAEANRRKFGRSKAERAQAEAEAERSAREHQGKKLDD